MQSLTVEIEKAALLLNLHGDKTILTMAKTLDLHDCCLGILIYILGGECVKTIKLNDL